MSIGLRWIKKTFDYIPRIGWHIDPFGHQATNAALFNQLGFNAWFFARIDYQDK
jgi:lysosomal alpha-mannosidase